MTEIKPGDSLPEATFMTMTDEGPRPRTTAEVFGGRKVALFAVPGAFTPTCHNNHLPSYLEHGAALKEKGVDSIACVSVNDVFVLNAWGKATASEGEIEMLADGGAGFTKAVGLDIDLTEAGLGVRSKRYAMLVDNGVVKALNIEDSPGEATKSSADALIKAMD